MLTNTNANKHDESQCLLAELITGNKRDYHSAEMEMGQSVMGHGSNGSPFLDGSRGSWVTALDPLTHDDEITVQWLAKKCKPLQFIFCS